MICSQCATLCAFHSISCSVDFVTTVSVIDAHKYGLNCSFIDRNIQEVSYVETKHLGTKWPLAKANRVT